MSKKSQFGRSMIEMLGVLAIIAVLTTGGIAGYSKAMEMWKISRQKEYLAELFLQSINLKDDFIIIYPPSFFTKSLQRGYSHIEQICREFSKLSGLKVEKNLIKKIKYTKPQYKVKDKRKNIKDSFKVDKNLLQNYQNKKLLLIDDITTTGATFEEIINCFLEFNFENIICLSIAKSKK